MFDKIAPKYDLLNHLLSFGLDILWRRRLANLINNTKPSSILDLATGTGDLLFEIIQQNPNIKNALGIDISEGMLTICRDKITKRNLSNQITIIQADATCFDFTVNSFDAVTIAFGIRNTSDVLTVLDRMYKALTPGGTAFVLEFTLPENNLVKKLYLLYLRKFIPWIGYAVSGNKKAYRYLNESIESFYSPKQLRHLMQKTGFRNIQIKPLTLGIAHIYQGSKTT